MAMRLIVIALLSAGLLTSCTSKEKDEKKVTKITIPRAKNPVVSIETSGDLYFAEGGDNIQLDFYGSCAQGYTTIQVQVENKTMNSPCRKGRYRYSFNLPKNIFKGKLRDGKYVLKKIRAYHSGHENLKAILLTC